MLIKNYLEKGRINKNEHVFSMLINTYAMKNTLTKRLQNYALLAAAGSMMLNSGCKKDEETTDDPNVEYIDIPDIVVDATTSGEDNANLDINKDGVDDIYIAAAFESSNYAYTYLYALTGGSGVASTPVSFQGENYAFAFDVAKGQSIKEVPYFSGYAYTSLIYKDGDFNFNEGFQGKGDKYVGVRFKIGSGTHFGWLKVNVANNAGKITIKEVAYNKVAGETLNAGDK